MKVSSAAVFSLFMVFLASGCSSARSRGSLQGPYIENNSSLPDAILPERTTPVTMLPFSLGPVKVTDLHRAAKRGDIKTAARLLKKGADINGKDNDGMTPLHYAVVWGEEKFAEFLLNNGADKNAVNLYGSTPLFYASGKHGAKLLLKSGALVNHKNNWGETSLFWAAEKGNLDIAVILVKNGADVKAVDRKGETPLHRAAHYYEGRSHIRIINLLLDRGADMNAVNSFGWTPLHWAVEKGKYSVASMFIKRGADINLPTAKYNKRFNTMSGSTPLHIAIKEFEGSMGIVTLLLKNGADVKIRNGDGLNSYEFAIKEAGMPDTEWYGTTKYKMNKRKGLNRIIEILSRHLKGKSR